MTLTLGEKEIVRAYQGEDIVYPTPIRDDLILRGMTLTLSEKEIVRAYQGEDIVYPTPIRDGLVLWYDFKGRTNQDINRGVAVDLSGNGNHGDLQNFAYTEGSGYGEGLKFDGVDDTITSNIPTSLSELSLEVTFKIISYTTFPRIAGVEGKWILYITDEQRGYRLSIFSVDSNRIDAPFTYSPNLLDGRFHNVWLVFKDSIFSGYVDGEFVGSFSREESILGDGLLSIGSGRYGSSVRPMNGTFCSVRLYTKALTPAEIRYNYEIEKTRWRL
jgi:hypothetical protein